MIERIYLPDEPGLDLPRRCRALLQQQKQSWEVLRNGYNALDGVQTRSIDFDGFQVKVQFNPARIASASAKVDEKSLKERKCFLCPANLPPEQRGLRFLDDYIVLCNPFPILPEHFTVACVNHAPQRILPSFDALLTLARDMGEQYTAFYNGPQAGASAPDHLHLQAGNRGFMPIDEEYETIKAGGQRLLESDRLNIYACGNYLRPFISLEANDASLLRKAFELCYATLQRITGTSEEPMMNIVTLYENGTWHVILLLRARHRPSCYYAEGDDRILVSPGCVDLGGVLITPIEADFRKLNHNLVAQIFEEVSLSADKFDELCHQLNGELRKMK